MKIVTSEIQLKTQGDTDVIDITDDVAQRLNQTGLKEGIAFVFVVGSTAGVTTCEAEPGLEADLKNLFEKLIPKKATYGHDAAWGDGNGHSHLRASLLGPSLAVPFAKGKLATGTWQQIIYIDFDNRPRTRQILVQFQGE
ncbi:MAG: secondary thiamine-phosphate synthase enzyme YjbQ [Candidatus Omnitrophota bacterium]